MVRLSSPYSNDYIKVALKCHEKLLKKLSSGEPIEARPSRENLYGDDVKMVSGLTLRMKVLTPEEKDEAVVKYESGMSMSAIARHYGCHQTTIGIILRSRNVEIR